MKLAALLAASLCSLSALAEHRAALLVGESAGDRGDAPLRYAEADAEAMRDVLVRLGGVSDADATLLRGATGPELRGALASLAEKLAREGWGASDRLVLYVSAHASAGELHLRGSRFPVAELRRFMEQLPLGVVLLVLDTCEAGAAVRTKGVVPVSGRLVQIDPPSLTGRIVIASSGTDEASLESDELGGSIFTRHLIAGLRGAADASHDGHVTLQEAYAYAYSRTIESSVESRAGRQTPVFDIDLKGAGELILSDLSSGRARLKLDVDQPGEWVIAPLDGGAQAARFTKGAGPVLLALDPGTWRVRTRRGDRYAEDIVRIADGGQAIIAEQDLASWALVPAGRKGAGPAATVMLSATAGSGAVAGLGVLTGMDGRVEYALDWPSGSARPLLVASFSELTGHPQGGAFFEREVALSAGGGVERALGPVRLSATGEAGALGVWQDGAQVFALEPRLGARLGAAFGLTRALSAGLSLEGGGLLVRTVQQRHVQPYARLNGGVGLTW